MRGSESVGGGAPLALRGAIAESPVALGERPRQWLERLPEAPWGSRWDVRIVAALTVLAAVLRVPNLGRSYWVDEGISIGIASHPIGQIPGLLRRDGSPPLFYYLLHYWLQWFGSSPVATHTLALVISLGVVFAAWWAGRTLFGRAAGLAAAGLAATSPFLNWYGTETRMYTLVCGLGCVAVAFVVRALRYRRLVDAAGAVVTYSALLYTHNWSLYLFAVTVGVLLVRALRDGDRALLRAVMLGAGAVFVLYLPWLPSFLVQARTTAAPWAVPPGVGDFFADPASMLGGTLGFVVAPLLAFGAWWTRSERQARTVAGGEQLAGGDGVGLLAVIGIAALALGWLGAYIDPSWTVRYLGVVFGPLILAAAGALATTSRGRAVIGTVCALCAGWSLIGSLLPNPSAHYAKSNVAAVAGAAAPDLRPGDVIVVAQTEQLAVVRHYLGPDYTYVTPTGPVADPTVVNWTDLVHRLEAANVCQTVLPTVAALPPGAAILEVNPVKAIGASGSTWSRAANGKVEAVDRLLAGQSSLIPTRSYAEATVPRPFSAVVGELFVKQAGQMSCI
ncbi:glycosyltransferase family 39 protein [Acidiferrimicrobium sp. IK]|uniref:glycosyltransferase family 39 protein n=1 Tax=Acidiferrimicrobium sp. IK TaxID=2871700 RepID=UPI0021CAEF4F|nr:glycosyltransferase family 39 protein [Acidiferrimicrobium sp. IK]MCU4183600.1 glycosyltransferase family 39 protein [Acidiferrimicrobium sp. IK]